MMQLSRGSGADLETRRPGEPALVFVEGEQFGRIQVERRGDVENVETAVTAGLRVSAREQFCAAEHVGPLGRNQHDRTAVEVRLKVGQSLVGVVLGESLGRILPVQARLEAHPLAEFIQQQGRDMQRLLHVGKMGGGRRRIVLPPVERT